MDPLLSEQIGTRAPTRKSRGLQNSPTQNKHAAVSCNTQFSWFSKMIESSSDDDSELLSPFASGADVISSEPTAELALAFGAMVMKEQEATASNVDITDFLVGMLEIAHRHRKVRMQTKPGAILTGVQEFCAILKAALDVRPPGRGIAILKLINNNRKVFEGLGSTIRACTARGIDRNQALADRWYIVNALNSLEVALGTQARTRDVVIAKKAAAATSRLTGAATTSAEEIGELLAGFKRIAQGVALAFEANGVEDAPDSASRGSTPGSDGGRGRTLAFPAGRLTPSVSPVFPAAGQDPTIPGDV
jgi:hypothetical protein